MKYLIKKVNANSWNFTRKVGGVGGVGGTETRFSSFEGNVTGIVAFKDQSGNYITGLTKEDEKEFKIKVVSGNLKILF